MQRKRRINNKKVIIAIIIFIIIFLLIVGGIYLLINNNEEGSLNVNGNKKDSLTQIQNHYNSYVKTNKEAKLYDKNGNELGEIGNGVELTLVESKITKDTKYFEISDFEGYYIKWEDVDVIEELSSVDNRYKNYIVFNENIVTNDITSFYDKEDNLIYKLNESFDLPIIIKDDDRYGVEFNNRLLYIKKDEVVDVKDNHNTDLHNASGVGVLNYHAFYDANNAEEKANCPSEICHSTAQFKTHLDFFKENNIFTVKMEELEMYIDGKLQLPKSVAITIDDGDRTKYAVDMLTEYKMNATIFLITSWYDAKNYYVTDYIELHSHSHSMHDYGDCPTGQGGGIQCLPESEIQEDLRLSREALGGSTVFCYPFYEYNEYSIEQLKKAGFTMAFIGESNNSDNLVHVGSDKFRLRRFVIVTYTTMTDLSNYFGQIK